MELHTAEQGSSSLLPLQRMTSSALGSPVLKRDRTTEHYIAGGVIGRRTAMQLSVVLYGLSEVWLLMNTVFFRICDNNILVVRNAVKLKHIYLPENKLASGHTLIMPTSGKKLSLVFISYIS